MLIGVLTTEMTILPELVNDPLQLCPKHYRPLPDLRHIRASDCLAIKKPPSMAQ